MSYAEVLGSADTIDKTIGNMEQTLSRVRQMMQRVNTEGTWKSKAAETAEASFNRFASQFDAFCNDLRTWPKFLRGAVEAHQRSEVAQAGMFEDSGQGIS